MNSGGAEVIEALKSTERVSRTVATEADGRLPVSREEFRRELMRRIELMDREIRGLCAADIDDALAGAVERLSGARRGLEDRLSEGVEVDSWVEARFEIILMWRRYRHEFEHLAVAWQRRHVARTGQRERGPMW